MLCMYVTVCVKYANKFNNNNKKIMFSKIKCNKKLSTACSFVDPSYFKIENKTEFSFLVNSYSFCYRAECG